ncbi:MAG: hypothetical protein IH942_05685, partial [Acidobacteria bacterium]|nr:hypothetical protein [Acidobacteriota bacterium]
PMPQTRYVLQKALAEGLKLILVINKLDRPEARPKQALDDLHYMLLELDATHEQLDAPVIYAIGRNGRSKRAVEDDWSDLTPLFETILEQVPPSTAPLDVPDVVAGLEVAVLIDPADDQGWAVFSRRLDDTIVELSIVDGEVVDLASGTRFDPTRGIGRGGDLDGEILDLLPAFTSFPKDVPTFWPEARFWRP